MAIHSTDILQALIRHTRAVKGRKNRKGADEYHVACPACGHPSSPKDPHCSFSLSGWNCFSCGAHGGLMNLADLVGLERGAYAPPAPVQAPPRRDPGRWLGDAPGLAARYHADGRAWEAWQAYKPVGVEAFRRCRLGYGVLPYSKCHHPRLIVPIFDGTMLVGLRGRAIDCTCGKWLAPGGTDISLYPLYNEPALKPGCVAWIVENPVDALLLTEQTPYIGVATYSVAYWYERWGSALREAKPELVVVGYDQDLPGNGGAARRSEFVRDWLKTHPRVPDPAGPRLANRLRSLGLPAVLYDWGDAPLKADIGSMIMAGGAA